MKIAMTGSGYNTRAFQFINEGLDQHPDVERVGIEDDYDYLFYFYLGWDPKLKYDPKKTVCIDYDDKERCMKIAGNGKCLLYFKRSWSVITRREKGITITEPRKDWPPHFRHIPYCVMDAFIKEYDVERDLDLTCCLRSFSYGGNRKKVLGICRKITRNNLALNCQLGPFNSGNRDEFNETYLKGLARSKIVVTCNPDRWEGDTRTWEALAAGSLVFVDRMAELPRHPLVHKKHCIIYDMDNLEQLEKDILYYINNPEEAEAIAKEGQQFALRHHRAVDRVNYILEEIRRVEYENAKEVIGQVQRV